jgi:hypothetical protein
MSILEATPEDRERRQQVMNAMMSAAAPFDLSTQDVLEVMLNLFAHSIVSLGVDDETAIGAITACIAKLRARKALETSTTLN